MAVEGESNTKNAETRLTIPALTQRRDNLIVASLLQKKRFIERFFMLGPCTFDVI
jgi:hypothetical protein